MQVSILGCGWLGLPLAKSLIEKGFSVNGSTTSVEKIPEVHGEDIFLKLKDKAFHHRYALMLMVAGMFFAFGIKLSLS